MVTWTAREIGVPASTDLAAYGRGEWRWAHQDEIRDAYGNRQFGAPGVEEELTVWLRARAWVSAESHPVLFARAVEHLIASKILLPGATTVWRLVGGAREHANERGWALLAARLSDEQRVRLEALLALAGGRRESELERLRRAPVEPTVAGLIVALQRVGELRALAAGLGGLDMLPAARMRALSVDAATRRPAISPRCPTLGGWRRWSRSPRSPRGAPKTTRSSTSTARSFPVLSSRCSRHRRRRRPGSDRRWRLSGMGSGRSCVLTGGRSACVHARAGAAPASFPSSI